MPAFLSAAIVTGEELELTGVPAILGFA